MNSEQKGNEERTLTCGGIHKNSAMQSHEILSFSCIKLYNLKSLHHFIALCNNVCFSTDFEYVYSTHNKPHGLPHQKTLY